MFSNGTHYLEYIARFRDLTNVNVIVMLMHEVVRVTALLAIKVVVAPVAVLGVGYVVSRTIL